MEYHLCVEMDGIKLKESEDKSEVLLGVTMQSNLKWSLQIEDLTTKLKKKVSRVGQAEVLNDQLL